MFLRSVGFSKAQRTQIKEIAKRVVLQHDKKYILGTNNWAINVEYYKMFGPDFGISVCGYLDDKEEMHIKYVSPFARSTSDMKCCSVELSNMHGGVYLFADDEVTGNHLSFRAENGLECINQDKCFSTVSRINMVGFSVRGTVVLPVLKDDDYQKVKLEEDELRKDLLLRARSGDDEAKLLLDIQEVGAEEMIRERLADEDFLSVVEGFFMSSSENNEAAYSVLCDILDYQLLNNEHTNENIYRIKLNMAGTIIDLYINECDLEGMPLAGMRFMGSLVLQGYVKFV